MADQAPTCYCGSPTKLRQSRYGHFYGCSRYPECDGLVGCHPGTTTPLGHPADKKTRNARREAHEALDGLWQPMGSQAKHYREAAYRWLAEEFGQDEVHIGEMDFEECQEVIELCEGMGPEDLRERMWGIGA